MSSPDGGWLGGIARLFGIGGRAEDRDELYRRVEELILGGPRRYTRTQLIADTGMSRELAARLWRSLGFADVDDDAVVFTDGDREAVRQLDRLRAAGLVPADVEEAVSRSIGQAMAGLADWQIEMLYQRVSGGNGGDGPDPRRVMGVAKRVLPLLEETQTYVWRRHLAAAAGRLLASDPDESQTRELTVGFADIVGFTRATRRLRPAELTELIEDFQGITAEVVATGHGRVVKTVGDEVLFVADRPEGGAEIALHLLRRLTESDTLPDVRIGLAVGPVVTLFGDVYGEAVNIAARLTAHARPGTALVDRNLAEALGEDARFQLRTRRPLAVRGYRNLHAWALAPAAPGTGAPPRRRRLRRQSAPGTA
ncbi:adenylate/guanylate cyclase domain-containing protein [Pseudonocardia acaciae]|uniref:adenylate/guanylate cyclase domain-containing protein n=1 Tax=Pseudonocardia acaciae TaxID=551276 RepID=UPI0007E8BAF1|nr:adenylate/guanylate cyclase domain-containing protein [Pseudonocardia acaciae]